MNSDNPSKVSPVSRSGNVCAWVNSNRDRARILIELVTLDLKWSPIKRSTIKGTIIIAEFET